MVGTPNSIITNFMFGSPSIRDFGSDRYIFN